MFGYRQMSSKIYDCLVNLEYLQDNWPIPTSVIELCINEKKFLIVRLHACKCTRKYYIWNFSETPLYSRIK
jgi:hypothetical protein